MPKGCMLGSAQGTGTQTDPFLVSGRQLRDPGRCSCGAAAGLASAPAPDTPPCHSDDRAMSPPTPGLRPHPEALGAVPMRHIRSAMQRSYDLPAGHEKVFKMGSVMTLITKVCIMARLIEPWRDTNTCPGPADPDPVTSSLQSGCHRRRSRRGSCWSAAARSWRCSPTQRTSPAVVRAANAC